MVGGGGGGPPGGMNEEYKDDGTGVRAPMEQ